MGNICEIKSELDKLFKLYKKNKSFLNVTQTNKVVILLKQLSQNGNTKDVAEWLVVFSEKVCSQYFDELTSGSIVPLDIVESIINNYISVNTDTSNEHFYVKKYATIAIKVINNYTDSSYDSKTIAKLIALVAYIGLKSDKNMTQFERVVVETKGKVYFVDYSSISERSLANVNKITVDLLTKGKLKAYTDLIEKWSIKYGFTLTTADNIPVPNEKTVKIEEVIVSNDTPADSAKSDVKQDKITADTVDAPDTASKSETDASSNDNSKRDNQETPVAQKEDTTNTDDTATVASEKVTNKPSVSPFSEKETPSEKAAKKLYISLKRDMDKEQEAIITAFTDMITPIGKAFETIQGEISKSREIGAENISLRAKTEDLGRQLSELRSKLQEVNQSLISARTENDELKKQIASLESQNSELDSKLNDAYAINSRESSLEAEKIRSELKKAFVFLYEDWLEYEFSDVSEENYESLQAIIKKIFRSLERNGIDFKGNN